LNLGPKRANRIPGRELIIALAGALAGAILLAVSGCGAVAKDSAPAGGQPPPEWAKNRDSWPSHNAGLSNTRANPNSEIDRADVSG
jgi:hypothetical protein